MFDRVRNLNWAVNIPCLLAWSRFELVYGQAWYVFIVQLQSDYLAQMLFIAYTVMGKVSC